MYIFVLAATVIASVGGLCDLLDLVYITKADSQVYRFYKVNYRFYKVNYNS